MVTVDSESLFNGAAAAVSTLAVAFFVYNVEFPYSPVSKLLLVGAFLAGVFALTQRTDDYQQVVLGYAVVVVSTLVVYFDVVGAFGVDDWLRVVGLLVIAGALFALGRRLDEDGHFLSADRARTLVVAVAVLAALVLTVDVATGGLAYELRTDQSVALDDGDRRGAIVGELLVSNPTPLPERVEAPRYRACAAGNWSAHVAEEDRDEGPRPVRAHLRVEDGYREHVMGLSTRRFPVRVYVDGADLEDLSVPVRRTDDCPSERSGEPYLAIFIEDEATLGTPD